MGRALPVECEHGVIVDYGDFGEHQNGCPDRCTFDTCPDHPSCEQCEAEAGRWVTVERGDLQAALCHMRDHDYEGAVGRLRSALANEARR